MCFFFRLLNDIRINNLSADEIAKIVITEAENESDKCFEYIVNRILEYREKGDNCLADDFTEKYASSKGTVNFEHPYSHLEDIANTIMNWMEYTQMAIRVDRRLQIIPKRKMKLNPFFVKHINLSSIRKIMKNFKNMDLI